MNLDTDLALASSGDAAAYGRVVDQCANTVCSIALAIVRDVAASEDIAQEVFLAAWTGLRKLRNPASFLPWLRQITRNQAHLWIREHRRELGDDDALAAAVDARPTPADALLAAEERRIIDGVLEELPEETREVLVLYYREGSSAKHVAGLLDISEDAVKQRLSRARAKVREELLQRFGGTLVRTAPTAAFATAVVAATTAIAPTAAAAGVIAVGKSAGSKLAAPLLSLAAIAGGLVGALGVFVGMKKFEPFLDEREERELKGFRNTLLATMFAASGLLWWSLEYARIWRIGAILLFFAVLAYLYLVKLPPILVRRVEYEQTTMRAALQTAMAMLGTVGMMLILLQKLR